MVSSINYAITANIDSIECGTMQQQLLWMLYDRGHLKNYPMALGMLLLHLTTLHFMCNNLNSDSETHSHSPNLEKSISLKFLVGQIIKRNIQALIDPQSTTSHYSATIGILAFFYCGLYLHLGEIVCSRSK